MIDKSLRDDAIKCKHFIKICKVIIAKLIDFNKNKNVQMLLIIAFRIHYQADNKSYMIIN